MSTLVIFSGLPGVGKSTLAQAICRETGAVYIQIDTIQKILGELGSAADLSGVYQFVYRLAEDNLELGHNVVVDCCNPVQATRDEWTRLAEEKGAKLQNVEVVCSDADVHRSRVEGQAGYAVGEGALTWDQIQEQQFDDWKRPPIRVDTALKKVPASVFELMSKIDWS